MTKRRYSPLRVISRDGRDVTDEAVPATLEEIKNFIREIPKKPGTRFVDDVTYMVQENYTAAATWGDVVKDFRSLSVQHRNALEDTADDIYRGWVAHPDEKAGARWSKSYKRPSIDTKRRFCDLFGDNQWNPRGFSIVLALASGMRVAWRPKDQRRALSKFAADTENVREENLIKLVSKLFEGAGYSGELNHIDSYHSTASRILLALAKAGVVDLVGNLCSARADMKCNRIISEPGIVRSWFEWGSVEAVDLDALMLFAEIRGIHAQAVEILIQGDA